MDGIGKLLDVVRIDEQSVGQFVGGAGERAEDQDAAFIVARSDEFLGHQIHAVVQRSDQANGSSAVVAADLLVGVMPVEQNDRPPATGGKAAVDAVGLGGHFLEKLLVARDVGAARRANLHEGEAALVSGIEFEKALDAAEAFMNSLGVVDAIDADAEK